MTTRYTSSVKGILSTLPSGTAARDKYSTAAADVLIQLAKAKAKYGLGVQFQVTTKPERTSRYVVVSRGGKKVQFRIADHPPSSAYEPWGGISKEVQVETARSSAAAIAGYVDQMLRSI